MALSTPTAAVLELMTMGQQSALHLGELLMAASPPMEGERGQALTAEILRCCDRVIAAISGGAAGTKRKATMEHGVLMPSKRRARGAELSREVRSGTTADGFMWRKYGQKDINGSNHPRFYYRCAYSAEGCGATRRVQQSHEDPAAFVIAYYGDHTCGGGAGDACQRGAPPLPPAIIDSNACGMVGFFDQYQNVESPQPLLAAEQSWRHYGEAPGQTSRGRWSSSSSSSSSWEAERGTSPVSEFLEGSLGVGWESVVNYLGFTDLP
ncbi:hypothetical protein QYE76_055677 [Lolium multiflorum]|uniref:WRKY domain-containing protein n=1 Tax=Lolium multiflorum TaxID=4521 RepID=A0AAD8T1U5_LOLMU|nr:hypothetical protein QYE76_055677 [Lolium multiflorum]